MIAIIGIVVAGLLFFFVLIPMFKSFLGNTISSVIELAMIVGVIWLCFIFPPIIIIIIGIVIFAKITGGPNNKKDGQ